MTMELLGLRFSLLLLLSLVASTSYYGPGVAADSFEPGPDYVYNLIYDHKNDIKPCVRLLHSEGEVGCSSPEAGVVGSLYPIETEAEYLDFKAHVSASWTDLKGIVLAGHLFHKTILDGLHQTKAVVGIALLPSNATGYLCGAGKTGFSPAEKYPNKKWGLHPDSLHEWNPCGSAWFMERLPFPVFALNEADGQDLLAKAKENKRLDSWPKWAAEFKAFMWGSGDSEICLRRGFCDPVGGQSVWGSFEEGVDKERDIILVMAQLDGNSIFQDLAIGAEAAGSGVTALLTAIHALADQRKLEAQQSGAYVPPVAAKRQLVFGFWTGETFGYLGSRKFVEDIVSFECKSVGTADKGRVRCSDPWMNDFAFKNISLSRIYALLDLQQLGQLDAQDATVYVHREPTSKGTAELLSALSSVAGSGMSVKSAFEPAFELPPSSLHSFLLANSSLPALLLSDFNSSYRNPYFQSRWDDWDNVRPESVCAAAGLVARALYALAYNAPPPATLQANCTLVSELLDCLVRNNTCDMKRELLGVVAAPNPPTGYAGLYRHDRAAYNLNALLVNQVLNRVMSPQYYMPEQLTVNCSASTHCPAGQNMGCVSGVCRNSSVYFHDAAPLGISWDADWAKWEHSNALFLGTHQQPLWTEPTWDTPSLRVFKKEQFLMEVLALVFGVLEFGVALGFFWLARRSLVARFGASPLSSSSSSSSSSESSLSVPST